MSMQTRKVWIFTKRGIALTKKVVVGTSIGLFCYEVFPNTVLLPFKRERQNEALQAKLGLKELPYQVQEYVRKVIDDMKFTEDQRKRLSVYLTDLNDVETLGNVNSAFGALVNLPWMLWSHYRIPEEIKGEEGKYPEATKQYFDTLQWSDNAKMFCAAYQVAWTTRYQFLVQGLANSVGVLAAFVACLIFSRSKNRVTDNPAALIIINVILIAMFHISWLLVTDVTACENEQEVIKEVCNLGRNYAEGAVEFYKKLQLQNKAIREITGFPGKARYTENGNTRTVRRYTLPLDERITLAEKLLEKYQNDNDSSGGETEGKPVKENLIPVST